MKRVCLYILTFLILADCTSVDQLCKLPVLITHYREHKAKDGGLGLVDFLSMHYWGNDANDHDDERDEQLPFKKFDAHQCHLYYQPVVKFTYQPLNIVHTETVYNGYEPRFVPNPALTAPFRPPCA